MSRHNNSHNDEVPAGSLASRLAQARPDAPAGSLAARLAQARAAKQHDHEQRAQELLRQQLLSNFERVRPASADAAGSPDGAQEPARSGKFAALIDSVDAEPEQSEHAHAPDGVTSHRGAASNGTAATTDAAGAALTAELEQARADLERHLRRAQQAEKVNEDLALHIRQAEAQQEEWRARAQQAETLNDELQVRLQQADARNEEWRTQAQQAEALNEELRSHVQQAEMEIIASRSRGERDAEALQQACVEIEQLQAQAQEAQTSAADLRTQVQQAQSEMVALKRRHEQDRAELSRFAAGETIARLIPIVDDLERALANVPDDLHDNPWAAGVRMIAAGLHAMLEQQGVERITPHGEPFDPHRHESIARVETDDVPEDTITTVYRPGYILNGRVLRPAQVQVATSESVRKGMSDA